MKPYFAAAAAALALASAPLAAQTKAVPLRFGWEPGMRAQVETEQVRVRDIEGVRDSVRMASTYRLEVKDHPQGLAVTYADMRWTELPDMAPDLGRIFEAMGRTSTGGRGRMIISDGGEFLRVDGTEALAQELRAALEPMLAEVDDAGLSRLRETASSMLSPGTLTATAADEWNALVGAWVDADLEMGEVYALESSFRSPVFGNVEIPLALTFRLEGRTACAEAGAEAGGAMRCVRLVMESTPEPGAVSDALRGFMERAGLSADEAEALFAQMAMETRVTLVAEPATLRPHRMQVHRVITTGEEDDAPMQVETRTFTYRYAP